jgi:nickel-dependent lactate racemase
MQATFAFGRTGLTVSLPDGPRYSVVEGRSAGALADAAAAIDEALDHPIGCQPLVKLAAGKRTAAISVCDITRPAPNRQTLPPLLERLHAAGIPVDGITILIATGLHRGATGEEIQSILGPEIAARYRVVNHDARALADHRSLGSTANETPVFIDRRFLDAELHITLGFIEQHLMLGFSGGRKLVAPGMAAQQTISCVSRWPSRAPSSAIRCTPNCWRSPAWRVTTSSSTSLSPSIAPSPVSSPALRSRPTPRASPSFAPLR